MKIMAVLVMVILLSAIVGCELQQNKIDTGAWDRSMTYASGITVSYGNGYYESLADGNKGNEPDLGYPWGHWSFTH